MTKVNFSEPLLFLHIIGMHPLKNNIFANLRSIFAIIVFVVTISSGILELCFHANGLETYARASDTMIPQCQLIAKMTVLLYFRNEIKDLLSDIKIFWNLEIFGAIHARKNLRLHYFLQKFFVIYKWALFVTCSQFVAAKLIFHDQKPVTISYGEYKGLETPYDELYLCLHCAITFIVMNLVVGYDGLFFFFVGHILSELCLIKIGFGQSDILELWKPRDRFEASVEHHRHILGFVFKFNRIFSGALLVQYLSCTFGICFALFLISKDGIPPNLDLAMKYLPYISSFILQAWTFCFAGSLLKEWSLEIPDEIFYTDWSTDFAYENVRARVIAIQRGQKAAKLTLGGFDDVDLVAFKTVMHKAFSFFAFINTIMN